MSLTYEQFLNLFPVSPREKAGTGVRVLCPAHADHNPSLLIKPPTNGFIADFRCFAGCERQAILTSLNLTWADLRSEDNKQESASWNVTDSFVYELESGKEYYVIDRLENDDKKRFATKHKVNGDYVFNLNGITHILFKLPELRQAVKAGKTILLPEGEGKVNRLRELGFEATTNPFGAGKWDDRYTKEFAGADVVIVPDYDKPGLGFVEQKARELHGTAKRIRIVQLTDVKSLQNSIGKDGVDIINWLDAGHTKEELQSLIDNAPDWKPQNESSSLVCMANVQPETVSWLWYPYIPMGKLTLLEGDPGIGKSWVTLAITTAVSLGKGLPNADLSKPQIVLLASAEDGLGDTLRPRLDAMAADVRNVHAIKGILDFSNGGLEILRKNIELLKPALVIIDPLVAYIGAGVDINRANETRAVMSQLAEIAEVYAVAILAVRHLTKGGALKAIYRGLGSIDFTAACRSVLMAGCDPDNDQKRAIVQIKSNLAAKGNAIGFELKNGSFYWTGESDLTAARILAAEDGQDGKSARDEATDFLRDELSNGPVEWQQIERDRKAAGISEITLRRARENLGIKIRREGESGKRGGGRSLWELPDDLVAQKDLLAQDAHIDKNEQVNQISFKKESLPKTDEQVNAVETTLGMPIKKVLEIWEIEGKPVIQVGPGESCPGIDKLLSNPGIQERHLKAIRSWLDKVIERNNGGPFAAEGV